MLQAEQRVVEDAGAESRQELLRPSVTVAFSDGSADTVTGDDPQVRRACALARSFVRSEEHTS